MSAEDASKANRWAQVLPYFLIQGVTGHVYAWSVFNAPLCQQLGVVASSSADWGLGDVLPLFSVSAATLGVCAASLGPKIGEMGPRASAAASAGCWAVGLGLSAVACKMHSLPLLIAGYGVLGGIGWGFGYIGPIAGLLAWFPDKRGMLQGLGMTSFGLGSLIGPVLATKLIESNTKAPTYLGQSSEMSLITEAGTRFADIAGELKEVIVAVANDAATGVVENGVYLVGSGDSGVAMTFATLGVCYSSLLFLASMRVRLPPENFQPTPSNTPPGPAQASQVVATDVKINENLTADSNVKAEVVKEDSENEVNITASEALKTKQFWMFLGAMTGNAMAGLAIVSSGKLLMTDCFAVALPHIATAGFCAAFVSAIATANTLGRLAWGVAGDWMGRRKAMIAFSVAAPVCAIIPTLTALTATSPELGAGPLAGFVIGTCGIITCYGGLFAVTPAYVADIFGPANAPAIMGRVLCGYGAAAIAGPGILASLRAYGDMAVVQDLASKVDPEVFRAKFGDSVDNLIVLWEKKTVSIQSLLSILPPDTIDPTYTLYSDTFYTMSAVLTLAAICSWNIHPISKATWTAIKAARKSVGK